MLPEYRRAPRAAAAAATVLAAVFAPHAHGAPVALVAAQADVSHSLTLGRFDPTLGEITGVRIDLPPADSAAATIRLPGGASAADRGTASGIVEINDSLKRGGTDSGALFATIGSPARPCLGGVGTGCGAALDYVDLPLPGAPGQPVLPDLPPPAGGGALVIGRSGDPVAPSYDCPAHAPADRPCAEAREPAQATAEPLLAAAVTPTVGTSLVPSDPGDDSTVLGIAAAAIATLALLLGTTVVLMRRATRAGRRNRRR